MEKYLKQVTKESAKRIYEQMENYLYRINNKEIGYFLKIKNKDDKSYFALITNSNILKYVDNNQLTVTIEGDPKLIELGDIRYEIEKYDKAIIEIKNNNDIKYFFEIDNNLFKSELEININYYKESIYIIQYDNKDNILVSYGVINEIFNKEIRYTGNMNTNIKDNIILNLTNNKIIGMDINKSNCYNKGIFINDLIGRFLFKINKKPIKLITDRYKEIKKNNDIFIIIDIDKNVLNKKIYFLDNYYYDDTGNKKYTHDHLKELNEHNTELYINGNKKKYEKYFIPEKECQYKIELKFDIYLTDCSYMFSGCENIKYIHFSNYNTTNINNMSYMFYNCKTLNSLSDISKWNTSNVNNMSYMFSGCNLLKSLPNISNWNTNNVTNMNDMFSDCKSLNSLPDISNWDTSQVNDFSFIFFGCESLKTLPDISKWKTSNITDKYKLFSMSLNRIFITINIDKNDINNKIYFLDNYYYDSGKITTHEHLKELNENNTALYINGNKRKYEKYFIPKKESEYKIELRFDNNLTDCSFMFSGCEKIKYIDFYNFDTSNIKNMSYMFNWCKSLNSLSDISKWITNNVKDMNYMFSFCESLNPLPDISKWNTNNVTNMSGMFSFCESLNSLPDISKWNTSNVNNMSWIFNYCKSLKSLPDISKWNTSNITNMSYMFSFCESLNSLPDISEWNVSNVNDMSYMFNWCSLLNALPDISKWNTSNTTKMSWMFDGCKSSLYIPKKLKNMYILSLKK